MSITIRHAEPDDYAACALIYAQPSAAAGTMQVPLQTAEIWKQRLTNIATHDRILVALADGEALARIFDNLVTRDDKGEVACLILETLPNPGDKCETYGLKAPAPEILEKCREKQKEQKADTNLTVCQIPQIVTQPGQTCQNNPTEAGWCYVENTATAKVIGTCSQAIQFSTKGQPPPGALTDLQCIQQFGGEATDGGK